MSEQLETCDENGNFLNMVGRSRVHRQGLWHKSVNVFVFHPDGRLYIQLRSPLKDVWPNAWDLSVGEHLKPGESYRQAALRGIEEELSIRGVDVEPWGEEMRCQTIVEAKDVRDFEIQRCFRAEYSGNVTPDPAEVSEVRLLRIDEIRDRIKRQPDRYTPWLRRCLDILVPVSSH
ncbi:MAG: Isopentenyl-diphosphate Delta-isomerase [Gammaproteobacteria bacterium]|nr:Isopentenyl-diphosphate Delta-isomerase [Gammaproteobacteria bacterium]